MSEPVTSKRPADVDAAMAMLAEPFVPDAVAWRPADFKTVIRENGKPMAPAVPYIDVRAVQDRLDAVFGGDGWYPRYTILPGGEVECQLYARFPGCSEYIMKPDVGSRIEDDADGLKGAYTDAMKRAAVLFGIGRYLYHIPRTLAPCTDNGKSLTEYPQLPQWAKPEAYRHAGPQLAGELNRQIAELVTLTKGDAGKVTADMLERWKYDRATPLAQVERRHVRGMLAHVKESITNVPLPDTYPQTGRELLQRMTAYDAELAQAKLCNVGDLLGHVTARGVKAQFPSDLAEWNGSSQIRTAVGWAKEYEATRKAKEKAKPQPAGAR